MPAAVADATLEENGSIERGRPRDGPGRLVAPDGTVCHVTIPFSIVCTAPNHPQPLWQVWETAGRGEFMNGRLHGSGRAVYVDGRVVEGEFVGGVLHGDGRRVSKDGTVWTGTFVDGKLEGTGGSIRTASGMIDEGEFHAGQLIRGTVTFPCGTVHTGSFVSGELHGEDCRVVRPNGSVQAAGAFWHGAPDVEGKCKSAGDLELVAQRAEAARWAAMARAQTERVAGLMFEMGDWPAKLGWVQYHCYDHIEILRVLTDVCVTVYWHN
eukprot:SAG31_NODE_137_length_23063_cov_5.002569_7_plen_267_part_00